MTTDCALLIGINYTGTDATLRGCHNDVKHMAQWLRLQHDVSPSNIRVLMDTPRLPGRDQPTRANILYELERLTRNTTATTFFIHYSGHGGTMPDRSGDEDDGEDSTLIPVDYETVGIICDDEFRAILNRFKSHQRVIIVGDCCHSGTLCDLPVRIETRPASVPHTASSLPTTEFHIHQKPYAETAASIVMLSGCRDAQTSADAYLALPILGKAATTRVIRATRGAWVPQTPHSSKIRVVIVRRRRSRRPRKIPQGALTASFLHAMRSHPSSPPPSSWAALLTTLYRELKRTRFSQHPQLSFGRAEDAHVFGATNLI